VSKSTLEGFAPKDAARSANQQKQLRSNAFHAKTSQSAKN